MTAPTQTTMAQYLKRLCAMQEECISDSVAFAGTTTVTGERVYWTNHIAGMSSRFQDPNMSSHVISVEALLVRGPITSGVDLENEARCQEDLLAVADYFLEHPSLTTTAPEGQTELRGTVPRSLTINSQGLVSVPRGNTTHIGTSYLITFAINRRHMPR